MGINVKGLNVNESMSCCTSRIETKNNALHNSAASLDQVTSLSLSRELITQKPNQLFENNTNISSSASLPTGDVEPSRSKSVFESSSYHYHDYSEIAPFSGKMKAAKFPRKLHQILSEPNLETIITWLPNGRAFKIKNTKLLSQKILPNYYRSGNYSSFKRQLHLWGFRRITHNQYFHEMFLRGRLHLCDCMKRLSQEGVTQQNAEDRHFVLKQFHELSKKYPILKHEQMITDNSSSSSSNSNISTNSVTTFEGAGTSVALKSVDTKKPAPLTDLSTAELTAVMAMKKLFDIAEP